MKDCFIRYYTRSMFLGASALKGRRRSRSLFEGASCANPTLHPYTRLSLGRLIEG